MPRLIALYPSPAAYVRELDRFFGFVSTAGVDLPFEGLNNESDMEVPYAYIFAGRPDRTQQLVSLIRRGRFAAGRGGWPGNDDSGALAAWYVWSALGLFPLVGQDLFVIGSPEFPRISFNIAGSEFTIEADGVSPSACFVQSATLDGRPIERAWLRYDEFRRGGQLILHMGTRPSAWGASNPPVSDVLRANSSSTRSLP